MPENNTDRGKRKTMTGRVVSDKMDKTIVVEVKTKVHHPLYGKTMKQITKLKAHDEKNESQTGDLVEVMETRRMSATKRWRLVKVLEKAETV
ncbi:MAG: 30S ribosomal protein S17 [Actinomycetota bacterium]